MSDREKQRVTNPDELARLMELHNPEGEPVGHFTSRCAQCGSKDLWDDSPAAYGCNCCGAIYFASDIPPHIIEDGQNLGPAWT